MKLLSHHHVSFTAALKTFRAMLRYGVSPPNVSPYTVMIRGFAAAGNSESESAMVAAASCSKEKKAWEASGLLTEKGVEPNLASFNAVIQGLCEEGRMEEADKVVEEMNRKGLAIDESIYNTLFSGMCKVNHMAPAIDLYAEMRVKGLSLNEKNYKSLIDLFCQCEEFVEKGYAEFVLGEMIDSGFSPSVDTYNALIGSYCNGKRVDQAVEIFRGMIERGVSPVAGIYKSLVLLLCSKRRRSEAFDLFRDMLRRGLSPDEVIYFNLMNPCCREGEFSKAFYMHHEMVHKGFLPDFVTGFSPSLVTCNALIHGLCFLGRAEEALEILRGMAKMGLSPDSVSYTTVISGFCQNQELRKAYDLKVEMDQKNIWWLDEAVYDSLMEGLSDEDTYSCLLNEYFAQGNLKKAYKLEYEMDHDGYLPPCVRFSVFLNGLNKKARTREAKEDLLFRISHMCLRMPTYITYDTLIENCSNNEFKSVVGLVKGFITRGLVDEAARAHDTMLEGNYKPDGAVYNLLIFDHCRCGNVHKAYDMYREMVHYGFAPHMFSVLALIEALYDDERYNKMSWVIQNTLRSCNLNDSELHKVLDEIDVGECEIDALLDVLAEIAMDGLLLDGGKRSYASAST